MTSLQKNPHRSTHRKRLLTIVRPCLYGPFMLRKKKTVVILSEAKDLRR
jgi:hypothetical protein